MSKLNNPESSGPKRPKANASSKVIDQRVLNASNADSGRHAPIKRDEVMSDLRTALKATANHIAVVGSDGNATTAFLGLPIKEDGSFGADEIDSELIQLERFAITKIIDKAYDFAFQAGLRPHRHTMDDGEYLRMLTFRRGSPRFVWGGVSTPMDNDNAAICRTIDTADARMRLLWKLGLTVRQLSLLANMSEPAARTSLSKEGIKTVGSRNDEGLAEIPDEDAYRWLVGRRGFVATLIPEPTDSFYTDDIIRLFKAHGFESGLEVHLSGASISTVAQEAKVDPDWLLELANGRPAKLDLEALDRVAQHLHADAPAFIGNAVENILRANAKNDGDA